MANTKTAVIKVEFLFDVEQTHCNVFYKSDEPGNPFWGVGWKTKSFGKSKSAIDILNDHVSDYILWNDGREELERYPEPDEFKSSKP